MIENATKTRIVVANSQIKIAKDCLERLILSSPAGKIHARLRIITARASER